MPIFEYRCENCGNKYDVLHKSSVNQKEVTCPKCNSAKSKKLLSTFSASIDGSSSYSSNSCDSGNCDVPSTGGCASGLCGLN
jgi:putative FmdB family regulatory protein